MRFMLHHVMFRLNNPFFTFLTEELNDSVTAAVAILSSGQTYGYCRKRSASIVYSRYFQFNNSFNFVIDTNND